MLKQIRQLHLYLGTFFAPSIIFFALTGAFQTYSLHEEHWGKPGIPLITWLAEVHKNQRLTELKAAEPEAQAPPAMAKTTADPSLASAQKPDGPPKAARRKKSQLLKAFVLLMAIGLISTTFLGIYMSFKYNRDPRLVWGLLALGTALPILLLYL